jgi:predicted DNA-binding transcriptional regulator YafY
VRFAPRPLPANDAAAYVQQSITRAPNRYEARVTLYVAADEIASRVPLYSATIEPIDAQSCEFRTGDDNLAWLALRIAMLGIDFAVHEPPELAAHLQALAHRFQRAAQGRVSAGPLR